MMPSPGEGMSGNVRPPSVAYPAAARSQGVPCPGTNIPEAAFANEAARNTGPEYRVSKSKFVSVDPEGAEKVLAEITRKFPDK